MYNTVTLGISPCPNDTFIFDAWINGRLGPDAPGVKCRLEDIATLNALALQGALDVVKVSFFAYGMLRKRYRLLQVGGALGRGCGPLVLTRDELFGREDLAAHGIRVAVPGEWTTACLLLSLYQPCIREKIIMPFDQIMPALARGEVDAGAVIHEGRFTYRQHGLHMLADLGSWWEDATGHPIPLGGIIARRSLSEKTIAFLEQTIRASLQHAWDHPEAPLQFMRRHAQEMDDQVMQQHVDLYVNQFSLDYGAAGRAAINCLLARADNEGLLA